MCTALLSLLTVLRNETRVWKQEQHPGDLCFPEDGGRVGFFTLEGKEVVSGSP